jgi:SAM-dependent methyltransferase
VSDEHVLVNRTGWDADAPNWIVRGREAWGMTDPVWGRGVPDSELRFLEDVDGLAAVDLGCGTGYISAWLMRRGARVMGVDNSARQLATAQMLQREFGMPFPLVHGDAEHLPFADATFDLATSQYGAAIWCDPYAWIPEAARILRPGGRLIFEANTPLVMMCYPTDDDQAPAEPVLHRDFFGMHRFEWHDEHGTVDGIEFHLGHGEMIRLLRSCGFEIEDLIELRAPETEDRGSEDDVPHEWARRWPSAEIWRVRKR